MEYSASHSRRQMRSARALLPAVFVSWIVPFPAACASAILVRSGYFTAFEFAREVSFRTSITFFALQLMSLVGVLVLIRMTGNKMRYFYCLTFVFIVLICSLSQYRDSLAVLASNIFSHFSPMPDSDSSELAKKKALEAVHEVCFVVTPYAVAEYVATLLPRILWLVCQAAAMSVCIEYVRLEICASWALRRRNNVVRDPEQALEYQDVDEKYALIPANLSSDDEDEESIDDE